MKNIRHLTTVLLLVAASILGGGAAAVFAAATATPPAAQPLNKRSKEGTRAESTDIQSIVFFNHLY